MPGLIPFPCVLALAPGLFCILDAASNLATVPPGRLSSARESTCKDQSLE